MTTRTDLLDAYKVVLEKELSLIKVDAEKAHKNKDHQSMKIILSYSRGLQRGFELCTALVSDVVNLSGKLSREDTND